jgi:hypothetical protein
MGVTLKEKIAQLPPERRDRIEAEAERLRAALSAPSTEGKDGKREESPPSAPDGVA